MVHHYINLGKYYFCAGQSITCAVRLFIIAHRRLNLPSLGLRRRHAIPILLALVAWRLRRKRFDSIELPVFGHFCRKVHCGYKVFDLANKSVTKIFPPGTPRQYVSSEVEGALAKDPLHFAPTILAHDLEQRWYAETYVPGDQGHAYYGADLADFQYRFERDIADCLEQILMLRPLYKTRLEPYALKAINRVKRRVSRAGVSEDVARVILRFIDHVREDLAVARDQKIWLGFSHGDFSMTNILRTRDEVAIIDWESTAQRSVSFDLYSYFFGELYYGRARPTCAAKMDRAMHALGERLEGKLREPPQITSIASVYRKLFYLERLRMISERRIDGELFARIASRCIKAFSSFEAALDVQGREGTAVQTARYARILADMRLAERPQRRTPLLPPTWPARATRALRRGLLEVT